MAAVRAAGPRKTAGEKAAGQALAKVPFDVRGAGLPSGAQPRVSSSQVSSCRCTT